MKWQVNSVLPPRRLIAPSLLTTEIVARSKHSSSKKLLLHEKLPKPPKGASKLTSFVLSLPYACTRPCGPKVFLLLRALASLSRSPSTKRCRLCKGLRSLLSYPLLVATPCFNPAEGPQTVSRSAECCAAWQGITGALDLSTHGGPPNVDFTLTLDSDSCSCEFGFVCQ